MNQSEYKVDINSLRNIQDQYRLRVLAAKANLPSTVNGMGIQEAFIAAHPDQGLTDSEVLALFCCRSIKHEHLILLENWAERVKTELKPAA